MCRTSRWSRPNPWTSETACLAFSNLFGVAMGDEPASVQHGNVTMTTQLSARRGAFETPYDGPVYVLDAMTNNPGAAGGALTNLRGELAGILGKQLRNALNNTWLNYAVPIDQLTDSVEAILAGRILPRSVDDAGQRPAQPWTLALLGIRLVPNVLPKTPPFVDAVVAERPPPKPA
jgi:S1-C subfamily serine protease